jgi:hypothetical protein
MGFSIYSDPTLTLRYLENEFLFSFVGNSSPSNQLFKDIPESQDRQPAGQPASDSRDRIARQGKQDGTAGAGQPGWDSRDRTAEEDSRDTIARTGKKVLDG